MYKKLLKKEFNNNVFELSKKFNISVEEVCEIIFNESKSQLNDSEQIYIYDDLSRKIYFEKNNGYWVKTTYSDSGNIRCVINSEGIRKEYEQGKLKELYLDELKKDRQLLYTAV